MRPPWVVTTKPDSVRSDRLTSSESTSTCAPNRSAISAISSGRAIAALFTPTLSAPWPSRRATSSVERTPPPTVSGMKTCSAIALHHVVGRRAVVDGRRDVEEGELVGALLVVARGEFDGVAGVAQVQEVDALDDAAGGHVEARDHTDGERSCGAHSRAAWIALTRIARAPSA